jgi:hypothetical protein
MRCVGAPVVGSNTSWGRSRRFMVALVPSSNAMEGLAKGGSSGWKR